MAVVLAFRKRRSAGRWERLQCAVSWCAEGIGLLLVMVGVQRSLMVPLDAVTIAALVGGVVVGVMGCVIVASWSVDEAKWKGQAPWPRWW